MNQNNSRTELIEQIILLEREMFMEVQNEGGRADCQDDQETFVVMRRAQLEIWDVPMLESYLADLTAAKEHQRNLAAEKYGFMMAQTNPEGFEKIQHLLPPVTADKASLVQEAASYQLRWMEEFRQRYPLFGGMGRQLTEKAGSIGGTSFAAYIAGELLTYSEETLARMNAHFSKLDTQEENPVDRIMNVMALAYGYEDVAQAEEALAKEKQG